MNRIRARWWMDAKWQDKLTGSSVSLDDVWRRKVIMIVMTILGGNFNYPSAFCDRPDSSDPCVCCCVGDASESVSLRAIFRSPHSWEICLQSKAACPAGCRVQWMSRSQRLPRQYVAYAFVS